MHQDTIYALATVLGKSGVAVIRLSGRQALDAVERLSGRKEWQPRKAYYTELRAMDGEEIDRGLVIYFPAPHSFTGEDVVELQVHGGIAVIRQLLEQLGAIPGLRHAEAGEFSRRAFENGKMDLMQAEGLADVIAAETAVQKSQAMRQMRGELSRYFDEVHREMVTCLAHLEATIDFPDEDLPATLVQGLNEDIRRLQNTIGLALADQRQGERVRNGIVIAILGAPNVGKSSLLNALARRDAAIVSNRAGTTRDAIEIHMDISGYPVILVDTAGLRESGDEIEMEGIRRAKQYAEHADIKVVLFDGQQWPSRDSASEALVDEHAMAVVTKADLVVSRGNGKGYHWISTHTGEGMSGLMALLGEKIQRSFHSQALPLITRDRHRSLLNRANAHLIQSLQDLPIELKCEEVRQAAQAVGKITGKIQVDDVLDVVFSSFCIGK